MTATFDRFDVCEVYALIEAEYNLGGWLHERQSNYRNGRKRGFVAESISCQLSRIKFDGRDLPRGFLSLTSNGRAIYRNLIARYRFAVSHCRYVVETCRELDTSA